MKAVDEALGALLSRERRHLIPTYQRDYEWTEEGQWQLLMDVVDVSTRLLEHRAWAVERVRPPSPAKRTSRPALHWRPTIYRHIQALESRPR